MKPKETKLYQLACRLNDARMINAASVCEDAMEYYSNASGLTDDVVSVCREVMMEKETLRRTDPVKTSKQIAEMSQALASLDTEEFWVYYLNRSNRIISVKRISVGAVHQSCVDTRVIMKHAVTNLASGMVLVHNHPSGSLIPSTPDRDVTNNIVAASKLFDVRVLDHIIISSDGWFSFQDHQLL